MCSTDISEEKLDMDWSNYTPDMLKKQISSPLRAGTSKGYSNDKGMENILFHIIDVNDVSVTRLITFK